MSRSHLIQATVISFLLGSLGSPALAQPNSEGEGSFNPNAIVYEDVADLFQKAAVFESGEFFRYRNPIMESLELIFGIPNAKTSGLSAFPEQEVMRDANLVNTLYEDYLEAQAGGVPIITRDLENPYDTSLGSPDYPGVE